ASTQNFYREAFYEASAEKVAPDRDPEDVYRLLIDTYRLRVEDDYNLSGEVSEGSLYDGGDGVDDFLRFLALVDEKKHLLPPWWTEESKVKCMELATTDGETYSYSLQRAVQKGDISDYYHNSLMPMQMRMFGEQVIGTGPGGQRGEGMLQMMVQSEGPSASGYYTHIGL
ncbi:hypothetical protein BGZ94_004095, partial [Podila epigama]